uniref:RING-type domain-containing protein n=1 Tax=Globisporangium ultimum (strain ATCC 200006 / CBS 805.95 / DAOM BR144) TaxID=431595 RepID=K3WVV2_GLOUD
MDTRTASPQHRAVDIPGGSVGVGGVPPPGSGSSSPESRTRLLVRDPALNEEAHAVRMNVLNSSVQEARDARNTRLIMWVITLVNLPQIIAAAIIMGLKWKDETLCYRIQIWVLVHTIHLSLTLSLEWVLYYLNGDGSNSTIRLREQYMTYISQLKYGLDLAGLFWFLVGNMWVISDGARCDDGSMMYHLALWMIIISYAKIFLPCLLLLALLPVICFCLPCVIRLLSRLQDPMRGKGATKDVINQLTTQKFQPTQFAPEDSSCCICLNEYEPLQDLRVLPCSHHFHKECVDEWLMVNSTCPTCRTSIFTTDAPAAHGTEDDVMRNV